MRRLTSLGSIGLAFAVGIVGCKSSEEEAPVPDAGGGIPDVAVDVATDISSDVGVEAAPDVATEAAPDVATEAAADVDAAADADAEACTPVGFTCDVFAPLPAAPAGDAGAPDAADDGAAEGGATTDGGAPAGVSVDEATGAITITLAAGSPEVASASLTIRYTTVPGECTNDTVDVPLTANGATLTGQLPIAMLADAGFVAPCGASVLHLVEACGGATTDVPVLVAPSASGWAGACTTLCGPGSFAASQTEVCTACPPAPLQCADLDPSAGTGAAFTYDTTAHTFSLVLAAGAGKATGGSVELAYYDGMTYCAKTFSIPLTAQNGVLTGQFGALPADFTMFEYGYLTGPACRTKINVDLECGASASFEVMVNDVSTPDAGAFDVEFGEVCPP